MTNPSFCECAAAPVRVRLRHSALALAALAACVAQAQEGGVQLAQNLRAPSMNEVVVTTTRTAQPLADIVADVSIVDPRNH